MQNSGLGNAVNPITSLTDPKIYDTPMLYVVGFRGMPGVADEPQHIKQGAITLELLRLLGIDYPLLEKGASERFFNSGFYGTCQYDCF